MSELFPPKVFSLQIVMKACELVEYFSVQKPILICDDYL